MPSADDKKHFDSLDYALHLGKIFAAPELHIVSTPSALHISEHGTCQLLGGWQNSSTHPCCLKLVSQMRLADPEAFDENSLVISFAHEKWKESLTHTNLSAFAMSPNRSSKEKDKQLLPHLVV